jgi:outer membrane protein assembly factor BamB
MEYLLMLAMFFVFVIIITNRKEIKESFSSFELVNTYTNVNDAQKAVAVGSDNFFAINDTSISKHDIRTGELIKQIDLSQHPRIKNLNGGVVVRNNLYVTNSPITDKHRQNTIEVFNKDLVYLYHINVTGNTGNLTWIDYYDGKWWGCFAHLDDMVKYTVLVEFYHPNPDLDYEGTIHNKDLVQWSVKDRWFFPHKVNENFKPYSCFGGSFGPDGNLYVTGKDKKELYVLNFYSESPIMSINHVKEVMINGGGISWDRQRNLLFGINKRNNSVFIYSQ